MPAHLPSGQLEHGVEQHVLNDRAQAARPGRRRLHLKILFGFFWSGDLFLMDFVVEVLFSGVCVWRCVDVGEFWFGRRSGASRRRFETRLGAAGDGADRTLRDVQLDSVGLEESAVLRMCRRGDRWALCSRGRITRLVYT